MMRAPLAPVALCGLMLAASPSEAQFLRDALQARELVCEFGEGYRHDVVAGLAVPRTGNLLVIYEAVTAESAEALSTQRPGRRPVRVRATDDAVHFIEPIGRSVRVTTLTACERWKARRGREMCVRFTARHAWHFDTLAHLRPRDSFASQPSGAQAGACEPWSVD